MRAGILTREFPPDVYGGAGVHVATSPGGADFGWDVAAQRAMAIYESLVD